MSSTDLIPNPDPRRPSWWFEDEDTDPADRWNAPARMFPPLPCGCYVRNGDLEPVLCAKHLAELNRRSP